MLHTVLCGHTGSNNRGCEAIVRSTLDLLAQNEITADIATCNAVEDRAFGLDQYGKLISYRDYDGKMSMQRLYNGIIKKVFHNEYPYEKFRQKDVFAAVKKAGSAVVIGGDTYCYNRNACLPAYNLNKYAHKAGARNVLWSCSIDAERIDAEMAQDLNRYSMIFPREQLTYQNLITAGIPAEKLFPMSDSAFMLQPESVELPEGFTNVFAYNPSYTLGVKQNREMIFESRIELLRHILGSTEMKIALIPHVYGRDSGDLAICREMAKILDAPDRVFVIDGFYNCKQLKYIISRCRFLVAERTHASIAGYSQLVPTFVLGYSVKSLGIAMDLFGRTEDFVIPSHLITDKQMLIAPVTRFMEMEDDVRVQLAERMPAYRAKAEMAARELRRILSGE